jgi:2-dehydro-3-deoxyphosphogluconate aldolase/(4S)-4-hydroxy-2-oxoglutarate aldolase
MTTLWNILETTRTLPVVVLEDATSAVPVAEALIEGGLPLIEITLRTPTALEAIRSVAAEVPQICVGAGTVLDASQVDDAVDAGASFIVSPGLSESVVSRASERNIPVIPGVSTASDIQRALELGFTRMKFFPANVAGGPPAVKAFASPFGEAVFIPTGGISQSTAADYLTLPNVLAVGGSWVVNPESVRRHEFGRITEAARTAVSQANQLNASAE